MTATPHETPPPDAPTASDAPRDSEPLESRLLRHLPRLRAFVRLRSGPLVRQLDDTGDLVQSVCREMLAKADVVRFDNDAAFRHWLFTEAGRKIAKRARYAQAEKRDRRRTTEFDSSLAQCYSAFSSPSSHAAAREQIARVEGAFDKLDERQRDLVTLAFVLGMSRAEIGARLAMSEGAVRTALHRAIARLSTLLDAGDSEGG